QHPPPRPPPFPYPTLFRSYCPPTMPPTPVAVISSLRAARTRSSFPPWRSVKSLIASANSPSPARIATFSPNLTCEVGENVAILRSEEHTSELQSLTNLVCR